MTIWLRENREVLERDLLHDFCRASARLEEQFRRFADTGTLSFSVLRDLVGAPMKKGLLWRLKDRSHHLFRDAGGGDSQAGGLLDWTLGAVFHESLKLMEEVYQQQHYAPRIRSLAREQTSPELAGMLDELARAQDQSLTNMRCMVLRLRTLFRQSRGLFRLYFAGRADNRPLARFFYDNRDFVGQIFQDEYPDFLNAVYGDCRERLYLEAARSLMESGRKDEADYALAAARQYKEN